MQKNEDSIQKDKTPPTKLRRDKEKKIINNTNRRIGIDCLIVKENNNIGIDGIPFVLPPLGSRSINEDEYHNYDFESWMKLNLISEEKDSKDLDSARDMRVGCSFAIIFVVFITGGIIGLSSGDLRKNLYYWGSFVLLLGIILIISYFAVNWKRNKDDVFGWFHRFKLITARNLTLQVILIIGIGFPFLVVFFFGDLKGLFIGELGDDKLAIYFGRILQLVFISVASIFPALLYFLFDRHQLSTLRDQFYMDILFLDPNVVTMPMAKQIYGKRVDEVYGSEENYKGKGKLMASTRWPIIIATLIITFGWIHALLPILPIDQTPFLKPNNDIFTLILPNPIAVNFGFIGVYFFSINMIFRRYVRSDLKPKAYSHIIVRFFTVVILVWVVSILFPSDTSSLTETASYMDRLSSTSITLLVLAFIIGIVPETGMTIIQEFLQNNKFIGKYIPTMHEKNPLSTLEGITLYDRARLLEEGIENVENLAHHDLIDLILQTRIPVPRLLDWLDQSILFLHTTQQVEGEYSISREEIGKPKTETYLDKLKNYGIRTATDLQVAHNAAIERKSENRFLTLLGDSDDSCTKLQVILDCLYDDEWLFHIYEWRHNRYNFQKNTYTLQDFIIKTDSIKTGANN